MEPTPALLSGESHAWRSLVGFRPWGRKESDTTEQLILLITIETRLVVVQSLMCSDSWKHCSSSDFCVLYFSFNNFIVYNVAFGFISKKA